MAPRRFPLLLAAATTLGGVVACSGEVSPPLASTPIDPERVAVAGLSSGAYMATQVHVALNARIHGAALVAGGPYGCAGGVLETALGPCMTAQPSGPDAISLAGRVRERASNGAIDALDGFAGDRVQVLHGAKDATVSPSLAPTTAALYRELGGEAITIELDDQRPFGHGLPVAGKGAPCDAPASPWLLDCGFDAAERVMAALFGAPADGATAAGEPSGTLSRFDQSSLSPDGAVGLADTGYVYTPAVCKDARCGALLVFHGCQQNVESVGEAFVREAGFNRWADLHRVVVVYPQTQSSYVPLNPKACWDWWGYGGADYDTREGGQLRFVAALLDRLAAAP